MQGRIIEFLIAHILNLLHYQHCWVTQTTASRWGQFVFFLMLEQQQWLQSSVTDINTPDPPYSEITCDELGVQIMLICVFSIFHYVSASGSETYSLI